jgi:hypothetical protein
LWDLFDVEAAAFKIRGTSLYNDAIWLAGAHNIAIAVDGFTWHGDPDYYWASNATPPAGYVSIKLNRSDGTATLRLTGFLSAWSDPVRQYPLWYLPWDPVAGEIIQSGIRDLRRAVHLPAMA